MKIDGFEWDEGNWPKCGKHGVSKGEIEAVFCCRPGIFPDLTHSGNEDRSLAIGRTGEGRYVFLSFTLRARSGMRLIRPISARYMHKKEIERYEKEGP